ncbi:MAG: hypothetical protein K5683_03745 [Prevotella sp.]|nr:hypothetical protein [Prevotella sp.]
MKKIYRFAMTAAAVCLLASCGNKGGEKAADAQQAETATEQVSTETEPSSEVLAEAKTLEADAFSLTAPAGWWVSSQDETSIDLSTKGTDNDKTFNTLATSSSVDETADSRIAEGYVELDKVTAGGIEYRAFKNENTQMKSFCTALKDGCLNVFVQYAADDDADVKAILESIKLK